MLTPSDNRPERAVTLPTGLESEPVARLAEANHRIANNLSLIVGLIRAEADSFASRKAPVDPAVVSRLLAEVAGRIDAVGHLHRLLSSDTARSTVDLADYLDRVCETLADLAPAEAGMRLTTDLLNGCRLRPDQILPLALIVNEAVTNAVKYAHPSGVAGRINVACRREADGRLLVEVRDDGVGLPDDFDLRHDGGLGLQVMRVLARQLGSELHLHSSSLGLLVQMRLPAVLHTAV